MSGESVNHELAFRRQSSSTVGLPWGLSFDRGGYRLFGPLPIAMSIANICSPTYPVGIVAISRPVHFSPQIVAVLKGKLRFNGASGRPNALRLPYRRSARGLPATRYLVRALGSQAGGQLRASTAIRSGEGPGTEMLLSLRMQFFAY